jgi:hypothetical protein
MMHLLIVLMLLFTAAAAGTAAGIVAAALLIRRYLRRMLTSALPLRDLQRRAQLALAAWQHTRRRVHIAYLEHWHRQWERAHR